MHKHILHGVLLAATLLASEARGWYLELSTDRPRVCAGEKIKLTATLHPALPSIDIEFYADGKRFATLHSDANGQAVAEFDTANPPVAVTIPGKIIFQAHALQYDYGWSNKVEVEVIVCKQLRITDENWEDVDFVGLDNDKLTAGGTADYRKTALQLKFRQPLQAASPDTVKAALLDRTTNYRLRINLTETGNSTLTFRSEAGLVEVEILAYSGFRPRVRDTMEVALTATPFRAIDTRYALRETGNKSLDFRSPNYPRGEIRPGEGSKYVYFELRYPSEEPELEIELSSSSGGKIGKDGASNSQSLPLQATNSRG